MIGSSNNQKVKNKLQKLLEEWMVGTGDPILECFRKEGFRVCGGLCSEIGVRVRGSKKSQCSKTQNQKEKEVLARFYYHEILTFTNLRFHVLFFSLG